MNGTRHFHAIDAGVEYVGRDARYLLRSDDAGLVALGKLYYEMLLSLTWPR